MRKQNQKKASYIQEIKNQPVSYKVFWHKPLILHLQKSQQGMSFTRHGQTFCLAYLMQMHYEVFDSHLIVSSIVTCGNKISSSIKT